MAVKSNTTLDPTKLFTSLSLLILLSEPLFSLFLGVMDLMSAVGCFDRIEKFLLVTSRDEKRVFTEIMPSTSGGNASALKEKVGIVQKEAPAANNATLTIRNGAFGWSKDAEPVLRNVDMTVLKGQLVAVVGPVGCGKSTLLKAILGETPRHEGEVQLSKSGIAWCEQEAWLINASLQKNIIGFSEFDLNLYSEVIHCCDLIQDLATLPNGDQTKIGSKGMSLSGGQKQRVVSVIPLLKAETNKANHKTPGHCPFSVLLQGYCNLRRHIQPIGHDYTEQDILPHPRTTGYSTPAKYNCHISNTYYEVLTIYGPHHYSKRPRHYRRTRLVFQSSRGGWIYFLRFRYGR